MAASGVSWSGHEVRKEKFYGAFEGFGAEFTRIVCVCHLSFHFPEGENGRFVQVR